MVALFLFTVWNLVAIASERYLAVCVPFKHAHFTRRKVLLTFSLIYIMAIIFSFLVAFQVGSLCFSHVKFKFQITNPKWENGRYFCLSKCTQLQLQIDLDKKQQILGSESFTRWLVGGEVIH